MTSKAEQYDDVEEAVQKLNIAYERYFLGLERTPPSKDHDSLKRQMRRLLGETPGNTAVRFRQQQLRATFITYESHWLRISKQIEEGTYLRHRQRTAMRMAAFDERLRKKGDATTAAPAVPQLAPGVLQLYNRYTEEQARLGLQPVSLEVLAVTLRDQTARIKEKYQCDRVDFRVAIKDGKVLLKAAPRNSTEEPDVPLKE